MSAGKKIPLFSDVLSPVFSADALPALTACQNDQYLIQAAYVVEQNDGALVIRAQAPASCQSCASLGACSMGIMGRWALSRQQQLYVKTALELPAGAWLWIGLPKTVFLRSICLLYLLPVLCFLLGGALGGWLLPQGWLMDLRVLLGMLLGLALGGLIGAVFVRAGGRSIGPLVKSAQSQSFANVHILWPSEMSH